MIIFKNHQLKIYILNFWIIWFTYLISISQISSKHLQKTILSKNIISNLLNNTNDEKKIKKKNK
jgi:TM2 domain-containing membrane protein YozV